MTAKAPLVKGLAFLGTSGTKDAFVQVLRQLFADPSIMEETYLYKAPESEPAPDQDQGGAEGTNIRIYKSFPGRTISYPAIIVSMGPFDGSQRFMGEERGEASDAHDTGGNLVGRDFLGYDIMPVKLTVYSWGSSYDRDRLTDILRILLQVVRRGVLAKFGLSYVNVEVGGDEQFEDARDQIPVYTKTITLQCQNDYNWFLDQDQEELITSYLLRVKVAVNKADPGMLLAQESP
jgi:hypothetical protein